MKRKYEKPEIKILKHTGEGIYLASGSVEIGNKNDTPACQSVYMNGLWQKPIPGSEPAPVKERRGCEGCSADDGDGCKILKGGEVNPDGIFQPAWERSGIQPDTLVW